jgi:transcriptional regulator with XRE-family HTH domain
MKDRILEFLKAENKSSALFAEEIGVQPSGISHILSGRNNPSLDFILKMLDRYKFLSTDWLLFGKGTMYKDSKIQSLFDQNLMQPEIDFNQTESKQPDAVKQAPVAVKDNNEDITVRTGSGEKPVVEKIVWFFSNNTFREYYPE